MREVAIFVGLLSVAAVSLLIPDSWRLPMALGVAGACIGWLYNKCEQLANRVDTLERINQRREQLEADRRELDQILKDPFYKVRKSDEA